VSIKTTNNPDTPDKRARAARMLANVLADMAVGAASPAGSGNEGCPFLRSGRFEPEIAAPRARCVREEV
jgi:hypothetical protein